MSQKPELAIDYKSLRPFTDETSSRNRVDQLFSDLIGVCHLANRIEIMGKRDETGIDKDDKFSKEQKTLFIGFDTWSKADELCDQIAKTDPKEAFKKALGLINITGGDEGDLLPGWLRGIGWTIIQSRFMNDHLYNILEDETLREAFNESLGRDLKYDIAEIPSETFLDEPSVFAHARAVIIAYKTRRLKKKEGVAGFWNTAKEELLTDSKFTKLMLLDDFDDTKPLATELKKIRKVAKLQAKKQEKNKANI